MPINTDPRYVGRASISPAGPVVAGELGTWTITYEVGAYGYDEFARLKIASRFASDWGPPQFTNPADANYATVRLESQSPTTVATLSWEPRGYIRPWFKCLVVSIRDGSLYPGDKVHLTIGDRTRGGPGSRAQTFREKGCEFRMLVDPFGTELYSVLEPSPQIDIVGGAIGLGRSFSNERGGTWGPRLIGLFGLSLIVAGMFSTDPAMGYPPVCPLWLRRRCMG